jgi:hypothetical protein
MQVITVRCVGNMKGRVAVQLGACAEPFDVRRLSVD